MRGVSVIICCYNSSSRIGKTLEHLQQQQPRNSLQWEVILVDNASPDKTSDVAKKIWQQNPVTSLCVVHEEKPGLMNARKRGLEEAVFDIVSFIDDDNWVEPGWVQKIVAIFESDEMIGACGGRSEAVFEKTKPAWFDECQNSFAVGPQAEQSGLIDNKKGFLWGAGLSFRRSLWTELQNRGFNNITLGREGEKITAGEDTELCFAIRLLGYHLYYHHDLVLKHFMPENRMNINYMIKMSEGFGKAYARLNCYRVLLEAKTFKLYPWWYEWIVAVKNFLILKVRLGFIKDPSLHNRLKFLKAYNKGYASQIWTDKAYSKEVITGLRAIFKK